MESEEEIKNTIEQYVTPETVPVSEDHASTTIHNQIDAMRQSAQTHLEAGRWSQASEAFLEILGYDAQDEDALLGLAIAYDRLNRYDALLSTAQSLLDVNPSSAQGLAYKARALQKLERLSQATIANDQALLLDTHLGLAWINRSGLQLLQQKFPEALRSAQRAIELAPNDARSWANMGVALLNFHRLLEALEAFNQSLTYDPKNSFALQMKGEILCKLGRMHEVIPLVQQVLASNPFDVAALTQGIQAFRALELYEMLRDFAQSLTKLLPDSLFAWEHYMRGLRGMGLFAEANQAIDRVLQLDPTNVRFWTMKADMLYRLERYREAVSAGERAVRLDQDYFPAHRIYEKAVRLMYQKKEKKKP